LEARPVSVDDTEAVLEVRELVDGVVVTEEDSLFDIVPVELLMPLVLRKDDALVVGLRV
jgi:hypothetical protein